MAAWGTVWTKEVKENLRDWRVIIPTLILGPIFGPVLLGVLLSTIVQQAVEKTQQDLEMPVIGAEYAPNLIAFLRSHRVNIVAGPDDRIAAMAAMRDRQHDIILLIEPATAQALTEGRPATLGLVYDQARRSSALSAARAKDMLEAYGRQLGALRLFARGIDPRITEPINVDRIDVSTPTARSGMQLSVLTYVLLFVVLMGGMPITNDATAGERERKSLEPLLTTPISRRQLVIEKIASASFFMMLALIVCLAALSVVLHYLPLEEIGMQSNFGLRECLLAFLVLLPFVPFGAGMMSVVSSFTKTYKEAQNYLGFFALLPTVPIMFAGVADFKPELGLMFIPSLGQHFLLLNLMKAEPLNPTFVAASAAGTLFFAAVSIVVAVRLYQREGIIG